MTIFRAASRAALSAALCTACSADPSPRPHPLPVPSTGAAVGVAVDPALEAVDPTVPLSRVVTLATDVPATVTATWAVQDRSFRAQSPESTLHRLPLIGFAPGQRHQVRLTLQAPDRLPTTRAIDVVTEALPPVFPEIVLHASHPEAMEPGDTLVGFASDGQQSYSAVFGPDGQILWLYRGPKRIWGLHEAVAGAQPMIGVTAGSDGAILRMDLLGQVTQRIDPIHDQGWHHEVQQLDDGSLIALSHEVVVVPEFPSSYDDPDARTVDAEVLVDHVVELAPDGRVVADHDLAELLPLDRIGYRSLVIEHTGIDWTHANSAEPSADGRHIVVSLRHQDAIFAIDRQQGSIAWILANPANWPPEHDALRLQQSEPFPWPYHQHAVQPGPDGRLLLFDNGNSRASPWTEEVADPFDQSYSRVIELQVDEATRTVRQRWSFQLPGIPMYSGAMGDADRMQATGNVLSLWGYTLHKNGIAHASLGLGDQTARIIEFAPETGEVAFDLELRSQREDNEAGWNAYRVHRIAPL